ncbi:hypothetical protein I8752_03795 [Nostocaceae cyanobacterium CENA369]|uniref:Uncharacterized protein n=1 Tax=Dendronalium phyllosphericum CENA369 TaxID=1725256 RepID=A0A8J7HZX2_9NOST|nr:hypothetical protein [Dendronalium phyllosphericum]MBH8572170.1 hypothetical protein [Dendronalium phyllosphericum CENA369]
MSALLTCTQQPWTVTYSKIIDVRSLSEFTEYRIAYPINVSVLNDAERAKGGTLYKQVPAFTKQKLDTTLVSKNISQHLSQYFAANDLSVK